MKNYIFDFDGTLADSKECSILATQHAFVQMNLAKPEQQIIEYYMGIPIEQSFKKMAGRELDEESFEQLLTVFRASYKEFENDTLMVFPYIPQVLAQLHNAGHQLFVVSSKKSDVLARNLRKLEIERYFKDIIGSDKVTHYKPHPEGILKLMELYELTQAETVMIGDAIFDLQMAKSAGVASCGVTWGNHKKDMLLTEEPTYIFDEVNQLLQL
ncbi:HAD family hydrolase [Ureibacillus sp. NPDC094379]